MSEERHEVSVPGWVLVSPRTVPEAWRSRGVEVILLPMTPAEAGQLLSDAPVEQAIPAADLPLVQLVARGLSAAEIARALDVTTRTVHRRVARLRDEFGVSTIQELATELARRGFGMETSRIGPDLSQDGSSEQAN